MYTGVSLLGSSLTCSLFSVCSAAVCSSVVGSTVSYSPGFISRSGRESISGSVSTSVLVGLVACIHLLKALYFLFRY